MKTRREKNFFTSRANPFARSRAILFVVKFGVRAGGREHGCAMGGAAAGLLEAVAHFAETSGESDPGDHGDDVSFEGVVILLHVPSFVFKLCLD